MGRELCKLDIRLRRRARPLERVVASEAPQTKTVRVAEEVDWESDEDIRRLRGKMQTKFNDQKWEFIEWNLVEESQ